MSFRSVHSFKNDSNVSRFLVNASYDVTLNTLLPSIKGIFGIIRIKFLERLSNLEYFLSKNHFYFVRLFVTFTVQNIIVLPSVYFF